MIAGSVQAQESPQTTRNHPFNQLVWFDEFPSNGQLDTTKWFHQTQLPIPGGWYNGEVQHYTNRIDNSYQANGIMRIVAKRETFTDQGETKMFTSARLNSKFAFTYGRVEVRAKLPSGIGTWPAIWTLGQNIDEDGAYWDNLGYGDTPWPPCGELDIMEHWGTNQDYISSATHTPCSFGGTINVGGRTIPNVSNTFHTYIMEWYPDSVVFMVDDVVHYTYKPSVQDSNTWPFNEPQYLLLNIAILESANPLFFQSTMEVDYVRVYQESGIGIEESTKTEFSVFPNPVENEVFIQTSAGDLGPVQLDLMDLQGRVIKSQTYRGNGQDLALSDLDFLAPSVYVVKINHKDQVAFVRFVKK